MNTTTLHLDSALLPASSRPLPIKTGRFQVDLKDLLRGRSELQIVHEEQVYVLRLTRNNKLILTK